MLIAWYKLDGNANDSSGNGYNGTWNGTAAYTTGKIGQAGSFNGSSTISFPETNLIKPINEVSVSLWFNATIINDNDYLLLVGRDNANGYALRITSSGLYGWAGSSSTDTGISANTTYHAVLTYKSGVGLCLYLNGSLVATAASTGDIPYNEIYGGPAIGGHGSSLYYFNGWIDDVRIYNHALSQKEVKELSKAKVLHYNFDDFQEPTTNILPNPIGFDATNWAARENVTVTTEQEDPFGGTDAIRIHPLSAVDSYFGSRNDILTIGTYSTSVWLKATKDTTVVLNTGTRHVSGANITYTASLTTYWKLFTYTGTTTAEPVHAFHVGGWNTWTDTSFDVFMAFPQVEQKDHATPFVNGSRTGVVRDISGYNNDATLALATTPQWTSDSKIGEGCYKFNGNDLSKFYTMNIGVLEKYTVSFWAKSTIESKMPIGSCGSSRNANFYWYWDNSWKYIHGGLAGEYYYNHTAGPSKLAGEWGHFCVTYDGAQVTIYRNAINEGSKATTGTANFTTGFSIGYGYIGSSYDFQGDIDDVRIYATALNSDDILELYQTRANLDNVGNLFTKCIALPDDVTSGLTNYWNFDANAVDSVSGNNGTVTGATLTSGIINGAYSFNGSSNYITLASTINLSSNANWSVSVWVKTTDAYSSILTNSSGGPVSSGFGINTGKINYSHYNAGWYEKTGNIAINTGNWTMLTWINRSNATMDMYVNGVLDYGNFSSICGLGPVNEIGKGYASDYFAGIMDDFRIYNRCLTPSEIKLLYSKGFR